MCIRDIGFGSNSTKIEANDSAMNKNEPKEDDWDKKDLRRKKIEEKNNFKEDKSEPSISHSLKKEFKKKKQETEEEEWEEWDRFYNR